MSLDSTPAVAEGPAPCPECASLTVRPSNRAYPKDRERLAGRAASFWRCENCGTRFLGPPAPDDAPTSRRDKRRGHGRDTLDLSIQIGRVFRRRVFPLLVVLLTIVAVVYVLDRQDRPTETIISPPN